MSSKVHDRHSAFTAATFKDRGPARNSCQQGSGISAEVHDLFPCFCCFCCPSTGLQGTPPSDFPGFYSMWLDLDLSESLSKVSPFIFFTIPAVKPSRVVFQPSSVNNSPLLKSRDLSPAVSSAGFWLFTPFSHLAV